MDFNRVAKWNSLRYAQEYNHALQTALATEEYSETVEAKTDVERLDGHIDQIYVALGGMWKTAIVEEDAFAVLEASDSYLRILSANFSYEAVNQEIAVMIDAISQCPDVNVLACLLANIANYNYIALNKLGYTDEEAILAAEIVCDSNDSKSIKKTASDVKANDGDKGALFIDPTPRLQTIVDAMLARRQ